MKNIGYFKLQAKNLLKDFKSGVQKHFPDDAEFVVLCEYGHDEDGFSLMKAQHIIALMGGFKNWSDLTKASEVELELAKLLFNNREKLSVDEWQFHVDSVEKEINAPLTSESKLEMYKHVYLK